MNGRWKVLFGRWKGDGIVVVAAPTSACVSSRLVRPTRLLASKGSYALIPEIPNSPLSAIGVSPDCSLRRFSETAGGHLAAAGHQ